MMAIFKEISDFISRTKRNRSFARPHFPLLLENCLLRVCMGPTVRVGVPTLAWRTLAYPGVPCSGVARGGSE